MLQKIGIQYMTFAQIFAPNCSLDELTVAAERQCLSAGFGQLRFKENHIGYDGHRL